jgi:hypothetical protein
MAKEYIIEDAVDADDKLGNANGKTVTIRVNDPNVTGTIGRLVVSRGGFDWYEGQSSKNHRRVKWADIIETLESGVERP